MTSDQLALVAGAVLSLVLSYVPGVSDLYSRLDATGKRIVMAVLLIVVGGAAFGLSCANLIAEVECTKQGAWGLVSSILTALAANQGMYLITPKKS